MPKKWTLTVERWPEFVPGQKYRAQVVKIGHMKNPPGMEVTLQSPGGGPSGRRQEIRWPFPRRENTLTAAFLKACRLHLMEGEQVDTEEVAPCCHRRSESVVNRPG